MTSKHGASAEHHPKSAASLHLWQIQAIRDIAVIGSLIGILYLGYLMRIVTVPLLAGLLLAYLFKPIVDRLSAFMRRSMATAIVVAVMYVAVGVPLVAATGVAAVQGTRFVGELREDWPGLVEKIEAWMQRWESRIRRPSAAWEAIRSSGDADEPADEEAGESAPDSSEPTGAEPEAGAPKAAPKNAEPPPPAVVVTQAEPDQKFSLKEGIALLLGENSNAIGKSLAGGGRAAFEIGWMVLATAGFLAFNIFFLVPFFFYFCSVGFGRVQRFGVSLIPKQNRDKTLTILRKMDGVISGFVRGRAIIASILGVMFTVGWWAVGVPAPLVIGPITGALSVVPYLALVGWPTAVIALWVAQAGAIDPMPAWQVLLFPTLVYWGVQTIDDYVLTPLIQGKQVGLDAPMILVAVLGAAAVAGVYGVLVAIPAAACIKILITDVFWPRYKQWAEGKADDPLPISRE